MTANLAASIRHKLKTRAQAEDGNVPRVHARYAIERLLYRLSQHPRSGDFILKGAMLFTAWPDVAARPTGDLDLLAKGASDAAALGRLFFEICSIADEGDGLTFAVDKLRVEQVREDQEYQGVRIKTQALLGETRIPVQIDIGFGDVVHPAATTLAFPILIDGMRQPQVLAYPPPTVVAEKFEAMVRFGLTNGRLKDYYDIWIIARHFVFDRAELAEAMKRTLDRRGSTLEATPPLGLSDSFAALEEKQALWRAFLERHAPHETALELLAVITDLRTFLNPVLDVLETPEIAQGSWRHPGGWSI